MFLKKNVSLHDSEKRIEVIVISYLHLLNSRIQVNGHPHDFSETPIQNLQKTYQETGILA